ncbi:fibronectin type III domain-containing protein [Pontibacter sp. G13]|uniref:fibronectin type III domain-containing protein n=1 Tax=Pontibacter sp. G13 TaxID=3074898 RepID=UPI002889652A|nr:fibronectin type III domain-containing protein [Pontibacter sp. G13]WNJ20593.1 fibronectin type III domain-containing protein [Pontibacter sp. G13]
MKHSILVWLLLAPLGLWAQVGLIQDDFSGPLDPAWVEYNSSGRVYTDQGKLVLDYNEPLSDPAVQRTFPGISSHAFVSFTVNAERNWCTAYVTFRNAQQDTIAQIIVDNGNGNAFLMVDDMATQTLIPANTGFVKNQDYLLDIELDVAQQVWSLAIDGNQLPAAAQVPFLNTTTEISEIQFYLEYMYNANGDTTLQNFYVDDFVLSDIDRSDLNDLIMEAQDLLGDASVGTDPGNVPQQAYDDLADSVIAAQGVLNDPTSDQAAIDQAVLFLQGAIDDFLASQIQVSLTFNIDTTSGHELVEGVAGYNLRIIDNNYTYTHPDFRAIADSLEIGWLRYFSGTTGDIYNARTGYNEIEWADQMMKEGEPNNPESGFFKQYRYSDVKGAYRLSDLYQLLGENQAKLIITFNAFNDTPEGAAALAKFCYDNHIIVEDFQMCNEPYFFHPGRGHYFFQNGLDYATRMEVMVDSIRAHYPNAPISMNYSWDAMGSFAGGSSGISAFANPYWGIFGKHSYAVYGQNDDFPRAMTRTYGAMAYLSSNVINDQQSAGWNSPMPVNLTEWGMFNPTVSKTYFSGVYAANYLMRMMDHPDVKFLGHHHLNSVGSPQTNRTGWMNNAYLAGTPMNVDTIQNGIKWSAKMPVMKMFYQAINRSTWTYGSTISGTQWMLDANNQNTSATEVEAFYAQALKGNYGYDYALMANASDKPHEISLQVNGVPLLDTLWVEMVVPEAGIESESLVQVIRFVETSGTLSVPPYAVLKVSRKKPQQAPQAPRVYKAEIAANGVELSWWKRANADGYRIHYGASSGTLDSFEEVLGADNTTHLLTSMVPGQTYFIEVEAFNTEGISARSNTISLTMSVPDAPVLAHLHPRNDRLSAEWWSVPGAQNYTLKWGTAAGTYPNSLDAGNITGARFKGLVDGQTYYCVVTASNGLGESAPSEEMAVTYHRDLPYSPVLVNASEQAVTGTVVVNWTESDSAYGGTHTLYRSTQPYGPWEEVASGITGTSYQDNGQMGTGRHYFALKTVNASGESYYFSQAAMVNKNFTTDIEEYLTEQGFGAHPLDPDLEGKFIRYEIELLDLAGRTLLKSANQDQFKAWLDAQSVGLYVWRISGETLDGTPVQLAGKIRS